MTVSVLCRGMTECNNLDIVFVLDGSASLHPLEWATVRNIMEQSLATLDIAPDRIYAGFVVFSTVVTYTSPQLIGNKQELLSGQSLSLSASPLPPAPSIPPQPPTTAHPHATFNEEAKRRSIADPMDNTDTQPSLSLSLSRFPRPLCYNLHTNQCVASVTVSPLLVVGL